MEERLERIAGRVHEVLIAMAGPYFAFFEATEFWSTPAMLVTMVMPFALLFLLLPFKAAAIVSFVLLVPLIYFMTLVLAHGLDSMRRPPRR